MHDYMHVCILVYNNYTDLKTTAPKIIQIIANMHIYHFSNILISSLGLCLVLSLYTAGGDHEKLKPYSLYVVLIIIN